MLIFQLTKLDAFVEPINAAWAMVKSAKEQINFIDVLHKILCI
jgi:hypothetical protein